MSRSKEKLEEIIAVFNKQEILRVKKFLNSPFFNQRKDVKTLFELLSEDLNASRAFIFEQIFPNEVYDDQKMRLVRSYLFRLIEKYLAFKEFSDDPFNEKLYLTKAYRKRGMEAGFKNTSKITLKNLKTQPYRNSRFYEYAFQLQWEQYQLTSSDSPSEVSNLLTMSSSIDLSYLTLKLKNLCLLAAHQSVYRSETKPALLEEVLDHITEKGLLNIPAIAIYYYGYQMFEQKTEERFFNKFKSLVIRHGALFPKAEIRDLYLMAINYCVRQLNDGNETYFKEAFDLYKEGLEKDYLVNDGVLSRFTYHNIVAVGLKIGEFNWVEYFIVNYKNTLERKYRDSSFSFNTARLEFSRKNYGTVLELLQRANYRDLLLNLTAKTLLLKTYFELNELSLLSAHLDAMTNYIRRKGIIGYHKTNYQNIVRYTKKLVNINPYDKSEKTALSRLIQKEENLTERKWLLEMLEK